MLCMLQRHLHDAPGGLRVPYAATGTSSSCNDLVTNLVDAELSMQLQSSPRMPPCDNRQTRVRAKSCHKTQSNSVAVTSTVSLC